MSAERAVVIELFAIVVTLAFGLLAIEDPSTGAEGVFVGVGLGLIGLALIPLALTEHEARSNY